MNILDCLATALGEKGLATGKDMDAWTKDWTGQYHWTPLCVARPANTQEVSAVLAAAYEARLPVVPVSGNTGLAGGTKGEGAIMLSLDRMNQIREVRKDARSAVVEAGVVLSELHSAAEEEGLSFPMTFGARGSCRIGGMLSTNAGGSNVLRYGNTRDLVLGVEVVLADGRVMDLMSALHKDNSGLNLKHLVIGAEGTLGVITAAVVKLVPKPGAYATAVVGTNTLGEALILLNRLQEITGGAVEAFEYMCPNYLRAYHAMHPDQRPILSEPAPVTLLVEVGATAPRDIEPDADGTVPITGYLEAALGDLLEEGAVVDAVVAQSEAQRSEMWAMREAAAEVSLTHKPLVNNDIAVALDDVSVFLESINARLKALDPEATAITVSHLGDGNIHYTVWPSKDDPQHADAIMAACEDEALALRGSFSAEHGIGLTKLPSMARRKDPVAIETMRAIKAALDPRNILNPGKVIPATVSE
ncbi:FAD-binding oxidoreductase [Thalassococcus lentus]|uniref:FAD-binding oxidoreductase n=1 Tax=Thalassococcus lentus TaxID=1210524 RepID=A0ABT4XXH4_9RHOB|nr:FAD-binding oxidoreductase [Thalassococcus lentus]MDA7426508.1 FAD-binding oxidoreductase [Thalassococcus lentus]